MSRAGDHLALDDLPVAVLHLDGDRRIVAANAALGELTGHDPAEVVGRPCDDVLDPRLSDGAPAWEDGWHRSARLRGTRAIPTQAVTVRTAGGGQLQVRAAGRWLRDDRGVVDGLVLTLERAERRGRREPNSVEIISTVSHELRSPLTSVKGYTSLLLNRWERLPDEQKQLMLRQVHQDADRVTRLVTELLDISRLETGRLALRRQLVDLGELARNVVEKVGMEYDELDCEVDVPGDLPRVYADPDKVEQVLTNLVENAAKYASPKGMRIVGRLEGGDAPTAAAPAEVVAVSVHDRGAGIPESDLPQVFTKFFRRDQGRPTGSGLGLWISRGLVEAHGGRLTATSKVGEGTTFRFTLPTQAFEELHGHQGSG